MANQTIYPYGQNGQLPSGYPIADDLKTNSAQQALSARQGVVIDGLINDLAEDVYVENRFDLEGLSTLAIAYYINLTNQVWSQSQATKSFFVPIKPGHKYRITASGNAARVAILSTNSYTVGSAPAYATGETNVRQISANGIMEFVSPDDGYFLSINYTLSNVVITPSRMVELIPDKEFENMKILGQPYEAFTGKACIDARVSSATFGKVILTSVGDTNWGFTPFFDLMGAKKILFYAQTGSTSPYLGNICGHVFYDEDYLPLTEGAILMEKTSTAVYEWIEVDVPAEARYLRMTMYGGNNIGKYWLYLWSRDADKPTLGSEAFSGYAYQGERIVINPEYKYRLETFSTNAVYGQSAALYGKYLFIVKDKLTQVILYDMESKAQVYTWTTNFSSQNTWHCNQSSFGTLKYNANDMFPVLYISQRNNAEGRAEIQVYRILPTLTDGEITSFTMVLVQTILLPAENETNCLGYPNVAIDTERGYMWAYSRYNTSGSPNSGKAMFTRFAIPALFDSSNNPVATVTLEDSNIQDHFLDNWATYNNQGAFIRNGKMYMMRGVPSSDHFCECNVIDLYFQRTRVSRVDLYPNGFTSEPEGCFYYNGTVFFTVNGTNIYRILFN